MLPSPLRRGVGGEVSINTKYYSIIRITPQQSKRIIYILLLILVLGLLNVYFAPIKYFLNEIAGVNSVNGCPLLTFTGIPCPLCGTGRVFSCITDLNFAESLYYNPLGLPFYIIFGFFYFAVLVLALRRQKIQLHKPALKLWYIPVLFIALMWILNIFYGHHH